MNPLVAFLKTVVWAIGSNRSFSRGDAVAMLQKVSNGVSAAQGADFFNEVVKIYVSMGIITQSKFSTWTREISRVGVDTSNNLLDAVGDSLFQKPELADVILALRFNDKEVQIERLTENIAELKEFRDRQTRDVIQVALNEGITALRKRRNSIKQTLT